MQIQPPPEFSEKSQKSLARSLLFLHQAQSASLEVGQSEMRVFLDGHVEILDLET